VNLEALVKQGVLVDACSLSQLERFGAKFPGRRVGVRFNPGLGSGHSDKANVGGPASSFGIWHELVPQVQILEKKYGLEIDRIHTHIGSGSDPSVDSYGNFLFLTSSTILPQVWLRCAELSLKLCLSFPRVTSLNLGGGYKVGRMSSEVSLIIPVVNFERISVFVDKYGSAASGLSCA
jgi:diaminopimelate decarboxylase